MKFSEYQNVSLRNIQALIAGKRDPANLCGLVHGRTQNKHGKQTIADSLDRVIEQLDKGYNNSFRSKRPIIPSTPSNIFSSGKKTK